jgi:predicted ATPase
VSDQDIFLRPEAQPVRYWVQLSPDHRQALDRLTDQLNAAVLRLDQTNNGHPTSPSWLFHETRTQLAFLDGTRGSGKTSLMSTLVARLTDPSALQFAPTNTKKDRDNSSEEAQYKSVSEKLKSSTVG